MPIDKVDKLEQCIKQILNVCLDARNPDNPNRATDAYCLEAIAHKCLDTLLEVSGKEVIVTFKSFKPHKSA